LTSRLLLSCGEASGDLYAGALIRALRQLSPGIDVFGLGGPQMAAAGGRLVHDFRGLSVTGLTEVVAHIPRLLSVRRKLVAAAREHRPDALVVIDYADFNFQLAQQIRRLNIPVVFYISPQIWAWRPGRIKTIKALADRVLVIFPFEEELYRKADVPVEFVGHPLIDLSTPRESRDGFLRGLGLEPGAPTVAVLPGSRKNEVSQILPDLLAAGELIRQRVPAVQLVVARAPHLDDALFAPAAQTRGVVVVEHDTDTVLASADLALTASGTATVQTALHDTPMVVVYRLSNLTYRVGRPFVKLDTFAMVNLIAGTRVVPELIQDAFTPDAVAREALTLLTNPEAAARMRRSLAAVREKLGGSGASDRAARAIVRVMETA
jgi:lipid-A-disaccharide synthase